MVMMMDVDSEVFELPDQELDFVLFGVPSHVTKFLILLAANDFVDGSGNTVCDSDLGLIGASEFKFPAVIFSPIKRSTF